MPEPRQLRRGTTRLLSVVMVGLGVAIVVRTLAAGGGPLTVGVLLGLLFIAAGAARLYLQSRMDRR
jgi:multisubunit Na+/H+ antiporter MnhB subunit